MKNELLWKPTSKRIENTSLFQFIKHVNTKHKQIIDSDMLLLILIEAFSLPDENP